MEHREALKNASQHPRFDTTVDGRNPAPIEIRRADLTTSLWDGCI